VVLPFNCLAFSLLGRNMGENRKWRRPIFPRQARLCHGTEDDVHAISEVLLRDELDGMILSAQQSAISIQPLQAFADPPENSYG